MSLLRRWALPALMFCLPITAASAVRAADDAPTPTAEETLVYKSLRDVINEGADMYNAQGRYKNMERDYAGCYHLYEGALMVARPLLARHADLQKAIDDGMAAARETPQMEKRAFVLREVIDKIREGVNPKGATVAAPQPPVVKETTTTGKIVNGEKGKLIVLIDGKSETFAVPDTAEVIINGKKSKLEELDFDRAATVTITRNGDVVTKVVAEVEAKAPVPPPAPPKENIRSGKITNVGADSLNIESGGMDAKYSVPATAKILLDGQETKLGDLQKGASVTMTFKGDVLTKVEVKSAVPPPQSTKTLWDRLGGEANVAKVVDDFVNTAGKDPKVNFWRDPTKVPSKAEIADLKTRLVEFVSGVTGGPLTYKGKSMKDAHKGMKITNEEFDAAANDLKEALVKHEAKPDDVAAVMKVVEGTRKNIVEAKEPEDKDKPEEKKPEEKKSEEKPGEKGGVSGKVSYKGKPVTGGMVILTGADGKEIKADLAADGTYKFKDVKAGQYTVAVDVVGLPAEYRSAKTSALKVDVRKGEQNNDIDLMD